MKLLVRIVLAVLVVLLGLWIWSRLPGVRTKVEGTVERYGGWTEEARQADPVGFVEFAEAELAEDVATLKQSRRDLAAARQTAEEEGERQRGLLAVADELAQEFKARFGVAEIGGSYPVSVRGQEYSREELIRQVESLLADRATYERVIGIYAEVVKEASARDAEILERIRTTEATLVELRAGKELLRVTALTEETDKLLAQVDELMGRAPSAAEASSPVRSVEELLAAAESSGAGGGERPDALEFLGVE